MVVRISRALRDCDATLPTLPLFHCLLGQCLLQLGFMYYTDVPPCLESTGVTIAGTSMLLFLEYRLKLR
jgi:hypothetical protein